MICQNCGQKNPEDCLFCVYCGTKMEDDDKTIYAKPEVKLKEKTIEPSPEANLKENDEPVPEVNLKKKVMPPSDKQEQHRSDYNYTSDKQDDSGSSSKSSYSPPPVDGKPNSFATISFAISIVCIITCCMTGLSGWLCMGPHALCAILGIVLGIMARQQIARSDGKETGNGYALAGIIISSVLLIGSIIYLAVLMFTGVALMTLPAIFQTN
jgi:hypothetical protein